MTLPITDFLRPENEPSDIRWRPSSPQNLTILDLGIDGAVGIRGEGIWLHDLTVLDAVLDYLYAAKCSVEVANRPAAQDIAGYPADVLAVASIRQDSDLPRFQRVYVAAMHT